MTNSESRPEVMMINCYNRMGSTGKIISDIEDYCRNSYAFSRIYEYEIENDPRPESYKVTSKLQRYFYYLLARLSGYKYCIGLFPTMKAISLIKKRKPAIVHMHCPNMGTIHITKLLQYLKKNNIPTVITNHAEFYYTGNCPHAFDCKKYMTGCGNCDYVYDYHRNYRYDRSAYEWKLMKEAFYGWKQVDVVSVSPWQMERCAGSPIMEGIRQRLVLNGLDESVFCRKAGAAFTQFREKGYSKVVLHVTANFSADPDDLKNGRAVIEMAKQLPHYAFVVVGPNAVAEPLPSNLFLYGWVSDQEQLAKLYSDADLTLMVSKRETFGMSCAESLCCGTPVVGYCAGGPETVSLPQYSEYVPYGDINKLCAAVTKWLEQSHDKDEISKQGIAAYKKANMGKGYKDIYDTLIGYAKD